MPARFFFSFFLFFFLFFLDRRDFALGPATGGGIMESRNINGRGRNSGSEFCRGSFEF